MQSYRAHQEGSREKARFRAFILDSVSKAKWRKLNWRATLGYR